jgi:hypothetical protein
MGTSSPWATTRGPLARREGESIDAKILSRIGQSPPFFALEGAVFDGTELYAGATGVTDPEHELGPASAAEIVRHALVAGLSCLALARPDEARAYYLPSGVDATFFSSPAPFGERMIYSAIGATQSPVGGNAQVDVRVGRDLVSRLKLSFAVVDEALFTRLFYAHRTSTFGDVGSYEDYQPFASCSHDAHSAEAELVIETSACRGHFHQYPTLPASTLLGQLVRLGSRLLHGGFRIGALKLRAPAVAWAGESLTLKVAHCAGPWNFTGRATVAGRTVASADLAVTSTPPVKLGR